MVNLVVVDQPAYSVTSGNAQFFPCNQICPARTRLVRLCRARNRRNSFPCQMDPLSSIKVHTESNLIHVSDNSGTQVINRPLSPPNNTPIAASSPLAKVNRKRKTSPSTHSERIASKQSKLDQFFFRRNKSLSHSADSFHFDSSLPENCTIFADASRHSSKEMMAGNDNNLIAQTTPTPPLPEQNITTDERLARIEFNAQAQFETLSKLMNDAIGSTKRVSLDLSMLRNELTDKYDLLDERMESNHNQLQLQHDDFKKTVSERLLKLESSKSTIENPDQFNVMMSMQKRIEQLERESKKLNISIRGLISSETTVMADVNTFLESAFQLTNVVTNTRFIPLKGKLPYIIIVHLTSLEIKDRILKGKKDLAQQRRFSDIFIGHDLTAQESRIAKEIRLAANAAKVKSKQVFFTPSKLVVDDIVYRWDFRTSALAPVRPRISAKPSGSNVMVNPPVSSKNPKNS